MGNTNGGKFPRVLYKLNVVRKKSGDKYKKTFDRAVLLLKKQAKDGDSKRNIKAQEKLMKRCKKYGISEQMLHDYVEKKWLDKLLPLVSKLSK
jgi:hypothetical protein